MRHTCPCSTRYLLKRNLRASPSGTGVEFEWASEKGALLALPRGASREKLRDLDKFKNYAKQNAAHWFAYASARRGWDPKNEFSKTLYLVTCCVKTSAWDIATCSHQSGAGSLKLTATVPVVNANSDVSCAHQWQRDTTAFVREGPELPSNQENQCVFVRGFKITLRSGVDISKLSLTTVVGIEDMAGAKFRNTISSGSSWNPLNLLWGGASNSSPTPHNYGQQRSSSSNRDETSLELPPKVEVEAFPQSSEVKFLCSWQPNV